MNFHKLNINTITKETKNAVSIAFDVPENLKSTFTFKAGQYITLKAEVDGEDIRRDYSLCINPKSDTLKVVVKEVSDGAFSRFANANLKVGDYLEVASPRGRFTFEPNATEQRTIVAFAAGSGITPIMSIAKTILNEELQSKFVLVYGNKTLNDTIFYNELIQLQKQYKERLHLQFVFSESNEDNALFGRIGTSVVNYTLNKIDGANAFYICGPESMIHTVSDTLIEKGIAKDSIKFELFTAPVDAAEADIEGVQDGNTTVTVLVDDEESSFLMPQSKTILESALENKIDAPYSCQGGICSSCIARITSGKAVMRQNNILTDSELAEGLILTCQAQPTTSTVSIDYDDV